MDPDPEPTGIPSVQWSLAFLVCNINNSHSINVLILSERQISTVIDVTKYFK